MAYFNIELAEKRGLAPIDIFLLQLIHQNRSEDMHEALVLTMQDENIDRLNEAGLITTIQGTKKMHEFQKLRLTKKGKKYYKDLQTFNTVDNDFKLFETLKRIYLNADKEIGSEKKTLELIAWFRVASGFTHREIWKVAKDFVNDERRMEYSNILEYVFWKSSNHFQTQPKLENSKLWLYYEKHKEKFDREFKKLKR